MNSLLNNNLFLIKEHAGMFKASNNFDIFDPNSQTIIMECRENDLSNLTKIFRFTRFKTVTPFNIKINSKSGTQIIRIERGVALFRSKINIYDENNNLIGHFQQKYFSLGGKFEIFDEHNNFVATLKGKITGWNFRIFNQENEFAQISKKWAGIGKEFFTSADNYMLSINEIVPANAKIRALILAATMCIDMVFKER